MDLLPSTDSRSTQAELHAETADPGAQLASAGSVHNSLRVREQQALLILNEMYQFVALLDAQGNELETNQTSLDAVGLRREDCIGHPFWEITVWPTSIIKNLQASFRHVISTGEFMRFEAEFFAPGKEWELFTTDITLKPILDTQQQVAFVVLEGRDISERKRAEAEVARKTAELQTLYDELRKLDRLKSMFYAMMNHDLRAPLTLILVPAESLLQESLDPEVRKTLEVVARNARLLLNLVNDLLEVSRLEQGKLELHYETCDLSDLVNRLSANFEAVAAQQQLTFRVQTPPHLQADLDPARIERVVLNLLSNAFKFTPAAGSITCCLEAEPVSGDASEMPAQVLFTVQDSGPGVPVDLREMIFEPFRQVETGKRRHSGGSGLGLAIVKDLVTLHGGTIRVDEAQGGGARFTVRLPQHPPAGKDLKLRE